MPEWHGPKVERLMRNGKRVYASVFKAWLVEQANMPGVSVSGLAMLHGINANQLRGWMKLPQWQAPQFPGPALLPVTIMQDSMSSLPACVPEPSRTCIEIELCGAVVRMPDGVAADQLRLVLAALRS